jgi:ketosteroid isomerase-like protein
MKLKLVFPVFIAFILCFGADASAQKQDKQTESVLQLLKKYDDAWNKKNAPAVGEILAPDYVYFTSTGGLSNRRDTLDFLVSPKYVLTFVERSEVKAFRSGDTVVVSSRWRGKGTYSEGEINDDQRCGQVFVRTGKKWQIISEHCTQIVSK